MESLYLTLVLDIAFYKYPQYWVFLIIQLIIIFGKTSKTLNYEAFKTTIFICNFNNNYKL